MVGLLQEVVSPINGDGFAIPHHTFDTWMLIFIHFHTLNDICVVLLFLFFWPTPPGWCHFSLHSLSSQELPAIDCFANSEPPEEKYWKPLWEVLGRGVLGPGLRLWSMVNAFLVFEGREFGRILWGDGWMWHNCLVDGCDRPLGSCRKKS